MINEFPNGQEKIKPISEELSDKLWLKAVNKDKTTEVPYKAEDSEGVTLRYKLLLEMAELAQQGYHFVYITADIDNLKQINSVFPRDVADQAIAAIFKAHKASIDKHAVKYLRFRDHAGGDDMDTLIGTKDSSKELAAELQKLEKVSVTFTGKDIRDQEQTMVITASIGISSFENDVNIKNVYEDLLERMSSTVTSGEVRESLAEVMHIVVSDIEEKQQGAVLEDDEVLAIMREIDLEMKASAKSERVQQQAMNLDRLDRIDKIDVTNLHMKKLLLTAVFGPILKELQKSAQIKLDEAKETKIRAEIDAALLKLLDIKSTNELVDVFTEILAGRRLNKKLLKDLLLSFAGFYIQALVNEKAPRTAKFLGKIVGPIRDKLIGAPPRKPQ